LAKLVKTALCVAVAGVLAGGVTSMAQPPDNGSRKNVESSQQSSTEGSAPRAATPKSTLPSDLSARKRVGKASFYAKQFFGKPMADGAPMDPQGDNAASRTLPLGTTAKVTNVETGKAAVVTIEDRGPYVDGRLVDLSPGTAAKIGLTPRKGVTKVVVAPIAVPLPNGKVKTGTAAHEPIEKPDKLPLHEGKSDESAESDKLAQSAKKSARLASVEDVATHDK
jgi:peptidoglycan lytic transglycosylase